MMEETTVKIVAKYLRKGNMARCLRDVLPSTTLSKDQREIVAETVHDVVRWKKLYDYYLEKESIEKTPEAYIKLAKEKVHKQQQSFPPDIQYSCSEYVADILKNKPEWANYLNQNPPTTLCVNLNKSSRDDVIRLLKTEQLPAEPSMLPIAVRTTSLGRYSQVVTNRYAHVMDEGSQLVSAVTAALGTSIFDFCAGNGGKSLAMASLTKNNTDIHAYDLNEKKRVTLEKRCQEYDTQITVHHTIPSAHFDVVLVDAPCTGLGATRRNPEAKYVDGPGEYPHQQHELLHQASQQVKPQGYLIYSVCTITPEETNAVIKQFLTDHPFKIIAKKNIPHTLLFNHEKYGAYTNVPEGDLFFISVLQHQS